MTDSNLTSQEMGKHVSKIHFFTKDRLTETGE